MFKPQFTTTHAITSGLTIIERARGFLDAATLSNAWIERMSQQALLLEAHHTTHIEGTHLSVEQSAEIWAGREVAGSDADDVRELLNYRRAFDMVREYLASGAPVSELVIREIHKHLVTGVRQDNAQPGQYRLVQNYVANGETGEVVYMPSPAVAVAGLMRELVQWLRQEEAIHPVLVAGIAQFQLVHIHPFVDGNGRASRLLSTLCLYGAGYDFRRLFTLSAYYDRDRPSFYAALRRVEQGQMDLTPWLEFFVKGLSTQLLEVKQRGEQAIQMELAAKAVGLNSRQTSLLAAFSANNHLSLADCAALGEGGSRRTLQRDLKRLLEAQLIEIVGKGSTDPTKYYRLKGS
jgi:Fic family protein